MNPTQFSGARVVLYGLLSLRTIALMSLVLRRRDRHRPVDCTGRSSGSVLPAPPALLLHGASARLVHRGLGEIVVALGFGPIMTLGAYFVQAQEYDVERLASLPVGILIALVLYVNEVPDRSPTPQPGSGRFPCGSPRTWS